MKRIAFYGGSFDPVHLGHLTIAQKLLELFELDEFVFIPAFHAPHKKRKKPTSPFHRFAMLCLASQDEPRIKVSKMELDVPERPYSVETLGALSERLPDAEIFFVMGADSWADITTWHEWEKVLTLTNHIVVTRPGYEIGFDHVTDEIRRRVVDMRDSDGPSEPGAVATGFRSHDDNSRSIYITDAINMNISAGDIRSKIREKVAGWHQDVPERVAKYIEKYELY